MSTLKRQKNLIRVTWLIELTIEKQKKNGLTIHTHHLMDDDDGLSHSFCIEGGKVDQNEGCVHYEFQTIKPDPVFLLRTARALSHVSYKQTGWIIYVTQPLGYEKWQRGKTSLIPLQITLERVYLTGIGCTRLPIMQNKSAWGRWTQRGSISTHFNANVDRQICSFFA